MSRQTLNPRRAPLLASVVLLLAALSSPAYAAGTAEPPTVQPVQLRVAPVDQPGDFFELTLGPGEQAGLSVELSNQADADIEARTYAADVDTIINGGFGAALTGGAPTGTTTWLDYGSEVVLLPAGEGLTKAFTVTVPETAPAGEYITSIVLENAVPVAGTGSVALDQTVRQAVAVSVTVPGPPVPAIRIGAARHTVVAGRSVVAVEVDNPGNVRLLPSGTFVLRDAAGAAVVSTPVVMDSFYAWTDTLVEVALAEELDSGSYTVELQLVDSISGVSASVVDVPLLVAEPAAAGAGTGAGSGVVAVLQDAGSGMPPWVLPLGAALLVLLTAPVAVLLTRRARRGRRPASGASHRRPRRSGAARTATVDGLDPAPVRLDPAPVPAPVAERGPAPVTAPVTAPIPVPAPLDGRAVRILPGRPRGADRGRARARV